MSVLPPSDRTLALNGAAAGLELKSTAVDVHATAARPLSPWARAARRLVFARLDGLSGGSLRVIDADGPHAFGDAHAEAPHTLAVADPRFYGCIVRSGSLGVGDAFVQGYWRCDDLVGLLRFFLRNAEALGSIERPWSRVAQGGRRLAATVLPNTRRRSRRNIAAHYDLSNEFFAEFLDPTMTYSAGIFDAPAATLQQASLAKYERIARKLRLSPADHVAEIGCGWGGFAEFAAARFGCRVTGVTISPAQHEYATRRIRAAGLAHRVDIRLCDYRDLAGSFDKLASIEMIEAIGPAQLPTYFRKCCELLKPEGLMAVQAITMPDQRYAAYLRGYDFIQKYIFPGGRLPSVGAMVGAVARATDFRLVHLEDFAEHYGRTLLAWRAAFFAAEERIAARGFDAAFRRAWDYYFSSCAAAFFEAQIGLAQLVLARPGARVEPS
jgi:cyclopropane-fatty-acyl-phospholipid synthase